MTQRKDVESGSVVFHHIGRTQFWLTPTNRMFLTEGSRVVFLSLQGSTVVRFDDSSYMPGAKIREFAFKALRKQREVRMNWLPPEEEETAFQYS